MAPRPAVVAGGVAAGAALLGAGVVVAGIGDDGGEPPHRDATGCPVAVEYVAEVLAWDVEVAAEGASDLACRYEPTDPGAHPGSHVLIVERDVADDGGYETILSGVQAEASAVEVLDEGAIGDVVAGAERGWVAELGRVVQVGVSTGDSLFQVTVADDERTAAEAREVAVALAADAIR